MNVVKVLIKLTNLMVAVVLIVAGINFSFLMQAKALAAEQEALYWSDRDLACLMSRAAEVNR